MDERETKSFISANLSRYIREVSLREHPVLQRLREETSRHPDREMQITPEQGQLLQLLVRATGARKTLEIGVFTGYSSTAVALALPPGGTVTALDRNEEFTSIAKRYWEEAGVSHKVDLRIGDALHSLQRLHQEKQAGAFDFAFIDADKPTYWSYFEACLPLLRDGGILAFDNTLQKGRVADPENREVNTLSMREFNQKLHDDPRVLGVLLPIADGLTLAVKS